MARILTALLSVAIAACLAAAQEGLFPEEPQAEGIIRLGCGGHLSLSMLEPRVFGGVMIRGNGPVLLAAMPVIRRVTFVSRPFHPETTLSAEMPTGELPDAVPPFARDDAEGVARSIESLFSIGHPLSLFRDDFAELDRWHNARIRALEELHASAFQEAARSVGADDVYGDVDGDASAAASYASNGVSEAAEQTEGSEEEVAAASEDVHEAQEVPFVGVDAPFFDLSAPNICGLVLLGLAFGLLVTMLLLSLSALIYGCSEEAPESYVESASHVETPLLQAAGAKAEESSVENPLCKYEPPSAKA